METFSRYWPFVREITGCRWIPQRPVTLSFECFIWSALWINGWVNNREAGNLRRHRAHYDVIVMNPCLTIYSGALSNYAADFLCETCNVIFFVNHFINEVASIRKEHSLIGWYIGWDWHSTLWLQMTRGASFQETWLFFVNSFRG